MVGRAAVGQPWLVGDIAYRLAHGRDRRAVTAPSRAEAAVLHYDTLLSLYGAGKGLRTARKHLAAYADRARADGFAVPPQVRADLVRSEDVHLVSRLLARLFHEPLREAA